jgi:hypothetical protein
MLKVRLLDSPLSGSLPSQVRLTFVALPEELLSGVNIKAGYGA